MEVSGQLHAPPALPPKKEPPEPIVQVAAWGPDSGLDAVEKRKNLSLPEIEPRPSSPLLVAIPTGLLCISVQDLFNDYES
jgi:hypothetical protein